MASRKEYLRQYQLVNKDKIKKQKIEYQKTDSYRKSVRIGNWKKQGIIFFDYNLLYDIFLSTNNCDYCNCEFTS